MDADISFKIGVLALQGAFREHISLLKTIKGVIPSEIRTVQELQSVDGLIIPGGESTTISLIAQRWGLLDSLVRFRQEGRPIWGTCAGLILLAERAEGKESNIRDRWRNIEAGMKKGGQALLGGLDILVARNFFGSQVCSFSRNAE